MTSALFFLHPLCCQHSHHQQSQTVLNIILMQAEARAQLEGALSAARAAVGKAEEGAEEVAAALEALREEETAGRAQAKVGGSERGR